MEPILNYYNLDWHSLIQTEVLVLNFKIFFLHLYLQIQYYKRIKAVNYETVVTELLLLLIERRQSDKSKQVWKFWNPVWKI